MKMIERKIFWINVEDELPDDTRDVLCYGLETNGGTPIVEMGFRSSLDDPKNLTQWKDFPFLKVIAWADIPWPSAI